MSDHAEYTLIPNLVELIEMIQADSIISKTFYKGDTLKAIVFAFDEGQELSEHTANQSAIIQILQGEASVTVGEDHHEMQTGGWLQMIPNLKHSVSAKTPLIMMLMLVG